MPTISKPKKTKKVMENNFNKYDEIKQELISYLEIRFDKLDIDTHVQVINSLMKMYNLGLDKATANAIEIIKRNN